MSHSLDGSRLVVADGVYGAVEVLNAADGATLLHLDAVDATGMYGVQLTADGSHVLMYDFDATRVVRVSDGLELELQLGQVASLTDLPIPTTKGRVLAVPRSPSYGELSFWEFGETAVSTRSVEAPSFSAGVFLGDGRTFRAVLASEGGVVLDYDSTTGHELRRTPLQHNAELDRLVGAFGGTLSNAFSDSGQLTSGGRYYAARLGSHLVVWDLETGVITLGPRPSDVQEVLLTGDGALALLHSYDIGGLGFVPPPVGPRPVEVRTLAGDRRVIAHEVPKGYRAWVDPSGQRLAFTAWSSPGVELSEQEARPLGELVVRDLSTGAMLAWGTALPPNRLGPQLVGMQGTGGQDLSFSPDGSAIYLPTLGSEELSRWRVAGE